MTAALMARLVFVALVAYNVGAHDWYAVAGSLGVWASVEAGIAYQAWHDRRYGRAT